MLTKQTMEMTERERIAVQNSNNQFLQAISYVAVGTIFSYAGKTVPETFMLCDGRSLDKTEYEELFNVIGYTFGGSEESFMLPDLRGKTLVGVSSADTNFDSVGKTGGAATHTLKENEMPSHTHTETFFAENQGGYTVPGGTVRVPSGTGFLYSNTETPGASLGFFGLTGAIGGDQPHNNMPPYLVCNYIIKVTNSVMKDDFRFPIDQTYNPESQNAQSGKALAVEFNKKADRNKILDYIVYTVDTGKEEVIITDCDTSISGSQSIPDIIEGYPVTSISTRAFRDCSNLTTIHIPASVQNIEEKAFASCSNLANVYFSNDTTYLYIQNGDTFSDCTSLNSIKLPSNTAGIPSSMFAGCTNLTNIYIPESVEYINTYAFEYSGLTDIYYEGSEEQWALIDIDGDALPTDVTIHYNQRPATVDFVNSKLGDIETLLGGI